MRIVTKQPLNYNKLKKNIVEKMRLMKINPTAVPYNSTAEYLEINLDIASVAKST